ncbi:MAG TPA: sigma-70 family RNA polymerase sigma factor [Saprospiraceae bacterium]|nr:sigma-70 family RNA polymerase sigma factor [Saprospiraceae bacterium]
MRELSDQDLIEGLRQRDSAALQLIYSRFRGRIAAQVNTWGGSGQDAQDIFQDALVAIFINAQKDGFRLTSSFYTYLYSICSHLWLKKFRENIRHNGVSPEPEVVSIPGADHSAELEYAERQQFVMEKFRALGDACRELLRLSIIEEKSPAEIMEQLGFGSIEYYYKRKSLCKEKLVELSRKDARFGVI